MPSTRSHRMALCFLVAAAHGLTLRAHVDPRACSIRLQDPPPSGGPPAAGGRLTRQSKLKGQTKNPVKAELVWGIKEEKRGRIDP